MNFSSFCHSPSEVAKTHTVSLQQCIACYSNITQTVLCNFTLLNMDVSQSTGVVLTVVVAQ